MPKISVIIPVYNAQNHLKYCIPSLLNQSFKEIEFIFIDDGSTDESLSIIKEFAQKDVRIQYFSQFNQGVSATRNAGIQHAKSNYIGFVDADDWIEPDMFEKMFNSIEKDKSDWVICDVMVHEINKEPFLRLNLKEDRININENRGSELLKLLKFKYDFANWNKLYKKEIILKYNICFNIEMTLWEDLLFNLNYFYFARTCSFIHQGLYHYRIEPLSLTRSKKPEIVEHYNLLFNAYTKFLLIQKDEIINKVFQSHFSKSCYYYLINEIYFISNNNAGNLFSKLKRFKNSVEKINPQLFCSDFLPDNSFAKFKYGLLSRKSYWTFSFLIYFSRLFK